MKKILLTTTAILLATFLSATNSKAATEYDENSSSIYQNFSVMGDGYMEMLDADQMMYSIYRAAYDSDGTLIAKYYYNWDEPIGTGNCLYSFHGSCTSTADLYTKETNATWKVACISGYDSNGGCSVGYSLEVWDSPENGTKLCDGLCAALYDSNGNVTQLTYYDTQTGKTKLSEESFDSNGKLTQRITYDSDGTTILGTETFAYDSDGNVTQKITYDSNDNIIGKEAYAKIFTVEQAYAATSKGNHNSISIRFK